MSIPLDDKRKYLEKRLDFINLSKEVNKILSEYDVKLNFQGFTDIFQEYINCDTSEIFVLQKLINELNYWIRYMGEVENIILFYMNHFLTVSEKEDNEQEVSKAAQSHFVLKNYLKKVQMYKRRFSNSRHDCIEKIKDSNKAFYREI